jgi:benzoate membrane transport protein
MTPPTPPFAAEGRALPASAVTAGILPPAIGFAGTVAVVIRAIQVMGGSPAEITSAITATSLAIGITGALLSWRWRMPVVLAWSTPGAALLASSVGVPYRTAIGAFVVAALLMMAVAVLPRLSGLAARIPPAIASGMLAGILLPFCLRLFGAIPVDPVLALGSLGTFVAVRAFAPRHALSAALAFALAIIAIRGGLPALDPHGALGGLSPHGPQFDWRAATGIGLPLFMVTLVSQNLPGLVVMQAAGYRPSPRRSFFATGLATLMAAPFGAFGVNLAAIVAALCTGPDAHPDRERRWIVGLIYGATWIMLGLFAGGVVSLLASLPGTVITILTGVALLGPLVAALQSMASVREDLDAAVATLVATASGAALLGVGSAFWGLVAGFVVLALRRASRARDDAAASVDEPDPDVRKQSAAMEMQDA